MMTGVGIGDPDQIDTMPEFEQIVIVIINR